jgi:hypothetical protein
LNDIQGSMRVFWHLVREMNVPMFKAKRATAAPRPRAVPASSGDPFAAARAALGEAGR